MSYDMKNGFWDCVNGEKRTMNSLNSIKKLREPKVIDTINFNGRYVDAADFRSKIVTASCVSAFVASFATFIILLLT